MAGVIQKATGIRPSAVERRLANGGGPIAAFEQRPYALRLASRSGFWRSTATLLGWGAGVNAEWALLFPSGGLGWGTCLL